MAASGGDKGESRTAPFTNFLLALAHSGQSLDAFAPPGDDESTIRGWGITPEQLETLRRGNLTEIQRAVQEDLGATDEGAATVAIWVRVTPWPWVRTS